MNWRGLRRGELAGHKKTPVPDRGTGDNCRSAPSGRPGAGHAGGKGGLEARPYVIKLVLLMGRCVIGVRRGSGCALRRSAFLTRFGALVAQNGFAAQAHLVAFNGNDLYLELVNPSSARHGYP